MRFHRTSARRGWTWTVAVGVTALAVSAGSLPVDAQAPRVAGPGQVDLTFIDINDFHGRIDGNTTHWAGTIEQIRAAAGEANSVLLSAGDNIGATVFASASADDQPTIDVLKALDLQASAVGNHEFDQGWADLRDDVIAGGTNADWPYLGANVYDTATGVPVLPEYALIPMGGLTVGVIGAVTQETPSLVSPDGVAGLTFGDPVEAVNRVAAQLSDGNPANGEAQVLIAEYHEGSGKGPADGVTLADQIAALGVFSNIVTNTAGTVDAIFTGHTHKLYVWDGTKPGGGTRPILQTGNYGENVGKVTLTVDQTTGDVAAYVAATVPRLASSVTEASLVAAYPRVAAVKAITDAALAAAKLIGNVSVGSQTADITTAFSGGTYVNGIYTKGTGARDNRAEASTMGDLVADSLVSSLSDPLRGGATIGVVNPGGLRAELFWAQSATSGTPNAWDPDGNIAYSEANDVLPFVNNLWTITLTGAQFKAVLEQQWQRAKDGSPLPAASRQYLQLGLSSNVTYTFDETRAIDDRITSITIDGQPYDPAGQYRIGAFSFLATGGDNFWAFQQGTDVKDSGLIDRDAWIAYVTGHSPLTPSFTRQGTKVVPVPTTASVGDHLTFAVSKLDVFSLGAPANTTLSVDLGGTHLGDVAVSANAASVDVLVPVGTPTGPQDLVLVASPSGTTVTLRVNVVDDRVASTTTLTRSASKQTYGTSKPATLTASVALADGSVATGSVDISANGAVVATVPLVNGVATWTIPSGTAAGAYQYTAAFADTNDVKGSTSAPVSFTVRKATSYTLLWASSFTTHGREHTPVTLTAFVGLDTAATPDGTVTFRQDGRVVATVPVANGRAVYTLPTGLRAGIHWYTASYSGTPSINGSLSNPIVVVVGRH